MTIFKYRVINKIFSWISIQMQSAGVNSKRSEELFQRHVSELNLLKDRILIRIFMAFERRHSTTRRRSNGNSVFIIIFYNEKCKK